MDKQILVYLYNGLLLSNKEEWSIDIYITRNVILIIVKEPDKKEYAEWFLLHKF